MLVTTCPDCDTTFKLTIAILEKAGGQVRCGRCARTFDANSRLREQPESATERLPAAAHAPTEPPSDDELAFAEAITSATGSRWFLHDDPPDVATEVPAAAGSETVDFDTGAPETEPAIVEAAVPEIAGPDGAGFETVAAESPTAMPEEAAAAAAAPLAVTDWREGDAEPVRRRTWPWAAAAGLMTLTLAAQLIHAARSELAGLPGVGPVLIAAYATFGREVSPPVALEQYASLDLTAVAEPVSDEHGWLIIETRVQNRGPETQTYPHILVRILDRWGETIAGRYFAPDEYVVTPRTDYSRMEVGSTVDAQFIIVDPGPDATGFELEFCARVEDSFVCDSR
jgi:predicted Zn finger-like uncharacterized protein